MLSSSPDPALPTSSSLDVPFCAAHVVRGTVRMLLRHDLVALAEVPLDGNLGRRVTDATGADHEDPHADHAFRRLEMIDPAITRSRAMANIEKPMTFAWAGIPRR